MEKFDLLTYNRTCGVSVLIQVQDSTARDWYRKEAAEQNWSVRTYGARILPILLPHAETPGAGKSGSRDERTDKSVSGQACIHQKPGNRRSS